MKTVCNTDFSYVYFSKYFFSVKRTRVWRTKILLGVTEFLLFFYHFSLLYADYSKTIALFFFLMTRTLTNLKSPLPQSYISEVIFSRDSFKVSRKACVEKRLKLITGKTKRDSFEISSISRSARETRMPWTIFFCEEI